MHEEKRFYPRFTHKQPARCARLDAFPDTFPISVVDIGPEGIGFICDEELKTGESLYLLLELATKEKVKFIIKVRWTRPVPNSKKIQVGVKIADGNSADLDKFIRAYYKFLVPPDQRKKIVIIDHDQGRAEGLADELIRFDFDATCAFDGEAGFAKYIAEHPDLIIVNLELPKIDGYGVCRKIRKLQEDRVTPIILLTDKKKRAAKIDKEALGVHECLVKPVDTEDLMAAMAELEKEGLF